MAQELGRNYGAAAPQASPGQARNQPNRFLDIGLAIMIAVYTTMSALTGMQLNIAAGQASEAQFLGLAILSDSNQEYLRGSQVVAQDVNLVNQTLLVGILAADGQPVSSSPVAFDAMSTIMASNESLMSPQLSASWDRAAAASPSGVYATDVFTEQYYAEIFQSAETNRLNALTSFDRASALLRFADSMQYLSIMLAAGLSVVGWASLSKPGLLRWTFASVGALLLMINVCAFAFLSLFG